MVGKSGKDKKGAEKEDRKSRVIVINSIRIILLLALIGGFVFGRNLVLFMSLFGFFLTFIPKIIGKLFKVKIPAETDIVLILFIYGMLVFLDVNGLFGGIWWMGVLLSLMGSIFLGLVGLSVMYVLYKDKKINANPFLVVFISFCFAVAVGAVWEVFEFSLDTLFGFKLQEKSSLGSMGAMLSNIAGALAVSFAGYFYIKNGKTILISKMISNMVEKNPRVFGSSVDSSEEALKLIKKGERKDIEFKSTLRTNLHTNQFDKKIEHSVLKTITSYLNSDGGTLLVGVDDKGEILGIEKDNFENTDKFNLHFTNLVKNHIGSEFLPFIKSEIVKVNGKDVLKIDCGKSHKHVFLKADGNEEFYVRNGPSSMKLSGSALIDYISHNFKK